MATVSKKSKSKSKKKGMSATKRNYFWDIGIALGFLIAFNPDATGYAIHEWLSLGLLAGLIAHVVFHWKWVVSVTKKFFGKLPRATRINYVINGGLALSFIMAGVSGFAISESITPLFGFSGGGNFWENIHELSANLSLLLVGAHVLMHWKWIVNNTKKYLWGGNKPKAKKQPMPTPTTSVSKP